MQNDLSIAEFEAIVTTRVLSRLLNDKETKTIQESVRRDELASKFSIAANGTLREFQVATDLRVILRASRVYIIYQPTGRIACEICIDGEYRGGYVRKPRAILMAKRGYTKAKTINGLQLWTAKLGETAYSKGGYHGKRY